MLEDIFVLQQYTITILNCTFHSLCCFLNTTEQTLFAKWSKTNNEKQKIYMAGYQKGANCPPKLAALNIAFNLIYVLTLKHKQS